VSEAAAESTLALPIFPDLTREQQDYVIESLASFYAAVV
jgi:dTDP-4-amino-4,6-dideoxygalactose transaminase